MSTPALKPWQTLSRWQREMTDFFRQMEQGARRMQSGGPAVNVWENETGLVMQMLLPGFSGDDVDVTVERDQLTVTGQRNVAERDDSETVLRHEGGLKSFNRSFQLPFAVDGAQTEAEMSRGVLTLRLVRPEAEQPLKVNVRKK